MGSKKFTGGLWTASSKCEQYPIIRLSHTHPHPKLFWLTRARSPNVIFTLLSTNIFPSHLHAPALLIPHSTIPMDNPTTVYSRLRHSIPHTPYSLMAVPFYEMLYCHGTTFDNGPPFDKSILWARPFTKYLDFFFFLNY